MTEIDIPTHWDLMYPTLAAIQQLGGSATKSELEEEVPQVADLSEEQLSVLFPDDSKNAGTSKVLYRMGWALTNLKKINAAENSSRGVWAITPDGTNYLNMPPEEGGNSIRKAVREVYAEERKSKIEWTDTEIDIPTHWDLMYPTLAAIQQLGGSASKSQLEKKVPQVAELSDEQLHVLFPDDSKNAGTSKVFYRMGWARTNLKKINAAENNERSVWSITPEGANYLNLSFEEGAKSLRKAVSEAYAEERKSKIEWTDDEKSNILIITGNYKYKFFNNINDARQFFTEASLQAIVEKGENETVEFKSTLRFNFHTNNFDKKIGAAVIKTIAGFLNTEGGKLLIGIADDGSCIGIKPDNFKSEDKMNLHLVNLVKSKIIPPSMTKIHIDFEDYLDHRIMIVECDSSNEPVYVKEGKEERFYVRMGASTDQLSPSQIPVYTEGRFK